MTQQLNDKPMVRLANPRRVTLANVATHAELHELAARAKAEAETPAGQADAARAS